MDIITGISILTVGAAFIFVYIAKQFDYDTTLSTLLKFSFMILTFLILGLGYVQVQESIDVATNFNITNTITNATEVYNYDTTHVNNLKDSLDGSINYLFILVRVVAYSLLLYFVVQVVLIKLIFRGWNKRKSGRR